MTGTWNLTQAWAWIRWRDAAKVAAHAAETHLGIAEEVMYPDGTPVIEDDHRRALLDALQDGRLVTRGLPAAETAAPGAAAPGAAAIAVPAADWAGLVPVAPSEARHARGRKVVWRALGFAADDLLRLWPGPRRPASLSISA